MVRSPHGARGADQGFSLIELVVAMVVLGTMAMAVIGVIMSSQAQGVTNRSRIAAANLAAREIDLVREEFGASKTGPVNMANAGYVVNPHPLSGGTAGQPLLIDGREYTVTRTAQWNIAGTGASACEGGSLVAYPTLGVTVSVTWPNMGSVQPVVSTASLAPDKDTGIPTTDSFIAAKVLDQNADPLVGIPVSATGAATTMGYTDASGCAVIRVSPAIAGTAYTIAVADSSYVDLSGTANPSKNSGVILQGQIYAGASFTVAQGGTVTIKIVRSDGQPLSDAQAAGSVVTLVASQYSGASGETQRTAAGVLTTIPNLWPTGYGGYFGSVAPTGGYAMQDLPPGGNITIEVPLEMASVLVTGLPSGTTNVLAVPTGTVPTTCGTGTSEPVSGAGATFLLMPAAYDFYAVGSMFACSPGPVNVALGSGDNEDIVWATTTIRIQGLAAGTVWIAEKQKSGLTSLTTCPTTVGAIAINIDGARTAPVGDPGGQLVRVADERRLERDLHQLPGPDQRVLGALRHGHLQDLGSDPAADSVRRDHDDQHHVAAVPRAQHGDHERHLHRDQRADDGDQVHVGDEDLVERPEPHRQRRPATDDRDQDLLRLPLEQQRFEREHRVHGGGDLHRRPWDRDPDEALRHDVGRARDRPPAPGDPGTTRRPGHLADRDAHLDD